jgi:hypothetical protein
MDMSVLYIVYPSQPEINKNEIYLIKDSKATEKIEILGGYHSALAQMLCIWISNVKINIHSKLKQNLVYILQDILIFPLINYLIKKDLKVNNGEYSENTVPTGYFGLIRK